MENKVQLKLYILIFLLVTTAVAAYQFTEASSTAVVKPAMSTFLENIDGYQTVNKSLLPENAEEMLNLDDYVFVDFKGPDNHRVDLYVGYYYTADKAYASHSPLVCYPSQGWKIDKKARQRHLEVGKNRINYEEIITSLGNKQELVLYWYQADRLTTTNAYVNKFNAGLNRVTRNTQQHAFIRVATPIDSSYENANKSAVEFISAFYPKLLKFMAQ